MPGSRGTCDHRRMRFDVVGAGYPKVTPDSCSVFVGSNNGVNKVDAKTGRQKWSFATGSVQTGYRNKPVLSQNGSVVYAAGAGSSMYAIDSQSGHEMWSLQPPDTAHSCSSPVVSPDGASVYVASNEGGKDPGNVICIALPQSCSQLVLSAVDAATGKLKWSFASGAISFMTPNPLTNPAVSPDGLTVYIASQDPVHSVCLDVKDCPTGFYAVDSATGKMKWSACMLA